MNIALEWLMRLEYQEHHALKAVAKYYRHRLPESLGKQLNDPGHLVHVKFFMATESAQASLFFTTVSLHTSIIKSYNDPVLSVRICFRQAESFK